MTEEYNLTKIERKLAKELDGYRYRHTMGVMYTAAALSMRYDITLLQKAQVAGLLHDCAKAIPNEKKIKMCEKRKIEITPIERVNPSLLHAKLGAVLAKEKYGVYDPEILEAIRWHTTGKADMSLLEKIIFIADYVEPLRDKARNLSIVRETVFTDLDRAVYMALRDTLEYIDDDDRLDETSKEAFAFYDDLISEL